MGCNCNQKSTRSATVKSTRTRYALVDVGTTSIDSSAIPSYLKFDSSVAASRALRTYPGKTIVVITE